MCAPHPDSQTATLTQSEQTDFFLGRVCDLLLIEKRLRRDHQKRFLKKHFFFWEKNDFENFGFPKNRLSMFKMSEKIAKKSKISQIISKKESVRDATPCPLRNFSTTVIKIYASEVLI